MRVTRNDLYERIADRDKRFVEIRLRCPDLEVKSPRLVQN
jgi:hypothetical protein